MLESNTMKVNSRTKLLLHACCAPCSIMCVETFRAEGVSPALFWYNPNIHPYTEYANRRDALTEYVRREDLGLVMEDEYGLREFLAGIHKEGGVPPSLQPGRKPPVCAAGLSLPPLRGSAPQRPARCGYCYRVRLERTAAAAKEQGFGAFSTTLLVSPYQDHDILKETGEAAAERYGVEFLYRDFRPRFREGRTKARSAGYYMQKYCGCIFSEEERYAGRPVPVVLRVTS